MFKLKIITHFIKIKTRTQPDTSYINAKPIMILKKLKESTAKFHQLAEELNFSNDLLNGSIKKNDYLILLKRLHGLFSQVAILQNMHVVHNTIPTLFFEDKSSLVYEDIIQLGDTSTRVPPFREISYYEYLGFCYVALGSMLGGQIIYRHIAGMQTDTTTLPLAFYASCKDSVLSHWKSFCNYLLSVDEDNHQTIINGTVTAYLYFIYLCTITKK